MTEATQDTSATNKPVPTKEERLAKIKTNIEALQRKYDDILNDRVPAAKPKKEVYLPQVGDEVFTPVGRNTATSQARILKGVVKAVKAAVIGDEGKVTSAAQVRVEVGEGFDVQLITVYPAQLTKVVPEVEAGAEEQAAE